MGNLTAIFTYVQEAIAAFTAFESGAVYTVNVPVIAFTVGTTKIDLGPFAIPVKKG